jgi:hypothetical protein
MYLYSADFPVFIMVRNMLTTWQLCGGDAKNITIMKHDGAQKKGCLHHSSFLALCCSKIIV